MKKHAFLSLALIAACLSGFAAPADSIPAKSWEKSSQNIKVVSLTNLTDDDVKEIMQGQHPELAVEFAAHTILPISFYLKGDLVNLIENDKECGAIEIKQTFYARCIGEELILSFNMKDWKPFQEVITGIASVTLSIQDGHPSLVVGSETNRRS